MKREVRVEDAVGMRLAHDMTRIVPGEFKGAAFKLGHIVQEEDIPLLLDMGKRHIYVLDLDETELHENDGAVQMADAIAGSGVVQTDVHEGKVILKSRQAGMVWFDEEKLFEMNQVKDISIAVRPLYSHVDAGTSVAGLRPIPLVIEREKINQVVATAKQPLKHPNGRTAAGAIDVIPYLPQKIAVVSTGSEIATGRIKDSFGPALTNKFTKFGLEISEQTFPGDEFDVIVSDIEQAVKNGATIVCVTGGMSVDPDDRSPGAITKAADEVVSYGAPVLPGSMTMLAYKGETVIFGLPGAVMHDKKTTLDLLLPRVLAGIKLTKADIARMGAGGWLNV
ncbi:molybdopterin-binding protein [Alicyclobacillus sp. SO9]|uniref:molybdopterin-binding protein n=1 Tax=Alicyclobacillus sp. SO9 TaxID=2665646 RepID=UPI001E3B3E86|nr:molybdopterin-binding protein [Alicyclobacillus sp. SO9]